MTLEYPIGKVCNDRKGQYHKSKMSLPTAPLKTVHGSVKMCSILDRNKERLKAVPRDEDGGNSSLFWKTKLKVKEVSKVTATKRKPCNWEIVIIVVQAHLRKIHISGIIFIRYLPSETLHHVG